MNLVTNGGFEVDTTGWIGQNGGSIARITSTTKSGDGAGQAASDGSDAFSTIDFTVTAPGIGTYILTVWLYAPTNVPAANIRCFNTTDGNTFGTARAVSQAWEKIEIVHRATAAENILCTVYPSFGIATARTLYIDDIILQSLPHPARKVLLL